MQILGTSPVDVVLLATAQSMAFREFQTPEFDCVVERSVIILHALAAMLTRCLHGRPEQHARLQKEVHPRLLAGHEHDEQAQHEQNQHGAGTITSKAEADDATPPPQLPAPEYLHPSYTPYELSPSITEDFASLSIEQPDNVAPQPSTVYTTSNPSILVDPDPSACRRLISRHGALSPREIIALIEEIFTSEAEISIVRDLRGSDAQAFIDVVHEVRLYISPFLSHSLIAFSFPIPSLPIICLPSTSL